jgi:hypothetical protein
MTNYDEMRKCWDRYIHKVRSQVYDFLNDIPYSELTVALSKELGVSNLHINYSVKEVSDRISMFEYAMKYESNDLAADSKLLSTIYREYKLASFGHETVNAYMSNGKRFSTEEFLDNFEDFDTNQKLRFQLVVGLHASYVHTDGGTNGCGFGYATYDNENGWTVNFSKNNERY